MSTSSSSLRGTVAVILAAGVGSRLRPWTNDRPKCLVSLGRETILSRATRLLRLAGVTDLVVATGYRAEMVRAALSDGPIQVTFVDNPDFASTQNVVSLARSLSAVPPGRAVLKLDGDVVFEEEILTPLARAREVTALVDRSGPLGTEEMKIVTEPERGRARIRRFGKGLDPVRAYGESIGIEWFPARAVAPVTAALDSAIAGGRTDVYYEDVYNDLLERIAFWAEEVSPHHWTEVDDADDLAKARARSKPHAITK